MSLFHISILYIYRHRTETKMTFFESSDQTGSETHISYLNRNENLALSDSGLTRPFSVVGLPGVRLQNGFDFFLLIFGFDFFPIFKIGSIFDTIMRGQRPNFRETGNFSNLHYHI